MEVHQVVTRYDCVTYDGTNGNEIANFFDAQPNSVTDDGTVLSFKHPNGERYSVSVDECILFSDHRGINDGWCDWYGTITQEQFKRKFRNMTKDSIDMDARIAALENEVQTMRAQREL